MPQCFDNFDNSHNSFLWPEYFIDYLCERWIPCEASTSVLFLHYRPVTVHCSTKDAYTSEITFLALNPCTIPSSWTILFKVYITLITLASKALSQASFASFWTEISRFRSRKHWSNLSRHSVICLTLYSFYIH